MDVSDKPTSVAAIALLVLLAGCGGGGGGSSVSTLPTLPAPAPSPATRINPNVDPSDTAADWTSARYDVSGSGNNALQTEITEGNVSSLTPAWIFHGTVGSLSSVAISSGTVYRTEEGGNTYAVDEATGAQVWNYAPVAPEGFDASPIVAAGSVYFPSTTGAFYVVSTSSGQNEFNYPPPAAWGPLIGGTELRAHYRAAPVYWNGTLFIGASNHVEPGDCMQGGQIMALDPLTPVTRAIETLTNGTSGVGVWTTPVFDASGNMYVATGNSCDVTNEPYGDSMLRLDPNSLSVMWSTPGPVDAHDLDFGATPVVVGGE
jgi:outer membrane protein assembly factor BamB